MRILKRNFGRHSIFRVIIMYSIIKLSRMEMERKEATLLR